MDLPSATVGKCGILVGMMVVTPGEASTVALNRMCRDGILVGPVADAYLVADMSGYESLRARLVAHVSIPRATVTGLANLWIRGLLCGGPPRSIELILPRGARPTRMYLLPGSPLRIRTQARAWGEVDMVGGLRLASVPHALAAALRYEDLGTAMATTWHCLAQKATTAEALHFTVSAVAAHGPAAQRMTYAWQAVHEAWMSSAHQLGGVTLN